MSFYRERMEETNAPAGRTGACDIVCLSHLRWDFVYQRPQHLMSRFARRARVFFVEEPVFGEGPARLSITPREGGLHIVVPRLPAESEGTPEAELMLKRLVDELLEGRRVRDYALWYYTPMAVRWTDHLRPAATVYDCMDELSAFRGAPPALRERERELFARADLVFTGGQSLYEAKRDQHPAVYAFPSSIDALHFARARSRERDPEDQSRIARPRLGFCGVIDERMDMELVAGLADARPDWQIVLVGPVVKIDESALPARPNVHRLGGKAYDELPLYLGGWDVALMPFAINEATRFISPTKTPEYMAAGLPVVSTPIRDVVRPYGEEGLVRIASTAAEFVAAVGEALVEDAEARTRRADAFLSQICWERTWGRMNELIEDVVTARRPALAAAARPSRRGPSAHAPVYAGGD